MRSGAQWALKALVAAMCERGAAEWAEGHEQAAEGWFTAALRVIEEECS